MRSHTLSNLNEDSRYTIVVRAINTAGSTNATITADTLTSGERIHNSMGNNYCWCTFTCCLHAAPTGIPALISFSDVNLTSITLQWTELPCSDRNGQITGYTVEYSSTSPPPHTNTVTVSGPSNTRLVVSGLLPRTNYTFSVKAEEANMSRSEYMYTTISTGELADRSKFLTLHYFLNCIFTELGFFLNGRFFSNNSIILLSDIGENSNALYCLTNRRECCLTDGTWISPIGLNISESFSNISFYFTRGFSSLLLNRRSRAVVPTGVYTCLIPDAESVVRYAFIVIFQIYGESHHISSRVEFL